MEQCVVMNLNVTTIFTSTILIPIAIGLVRLGRIRASYQPFLVFLLLAFTAELVGYISIRLVHNNNVSTNIYTLMEAVVIAYIFYAWGFFRRHKTLFIALLALYSMVWSAENIVLGGLESQICSYFIMLYSLVTVLLCINEVNALVSMRGNLFRNARFLICMGLIIMCVYSLITEGTLLIDPDNGPLSIKIFTFYVYINAFVNIVYAVAVYFMPERDDIYFSKRFNA